MNNSNVLQFPTKQNATNTVAVLTNSQQDFFTLTADNSLTDRGVFDGDVLIVDKFRQAKTNDLVVDAKNNMRVFNGGDYVGVVTGFQRSLLD